jgi:prefoldin subunit 5
MELEQVVKQLQDALSEYYKAKRAIANALLADLVLAPEIETLIEVGEGAVERLTAVIDSIDNELHQAKQYLGVRLPEDD